MDKLKKFLEPFKEVPAALKTFPKGLIALWKEPVTNSEEVEKKKNALRPWMYFFGGLIAAGFLIMIIGVIIKVNFVKDTLATIVYGPGFIGMVYCGFLYFIANKAAKKFKDIECDNCKKRMPYGAHVTFKVLSTTYTVKKEKRKNEHSGGMNAKVTGTERIKVEVTSVCPFCGTVNVFEQEFRTVVCERFQAGVSAMQVDAVILSFEKDVRMEQKLGFTGETGATIRGLQTPEQLVMGYFGDMIQVG